MIFAPKAIKINQSDNTAVALSDIKTGDDVFGVKAVGEVPTAHKIALNQIKTGESIIKYGHPIGSATTEIKPGEHVHTHNVKTNLRGTLSYTYTPATVPKTPPSADKKSFMGYKRANGEVGIRNEIWIISTVGCVNKTAEKIADEADRKYRGNPRVDGVYTFLHPYGCSQLGDDHVFTQKILAGMVAHPNAAGVLVLGLGCENNLIGDFKKILGTWDERRVKFLNAQDVVNEVAEGLGLVDELAEYASTFERVKIPVEKLVIGLKCGGSDAFSGITANPLVGCFCDRLITDGGTCVLTEVPEMFGAETLLMDRAADEGVFTETVNLVNDFKDYFTRHGQEIYENPSPGNKEGGISTLEEKSLGCTQKGGTCQVTDVLDYGERVKRPGLNLLQGPGNDIVAVTNLTAAGAHIVLFTTGRGTPLGAPVPTVKISSNTALAKTKPHWIDFDAGKLLDETSIEDLTELFYEYIIGVASGDFTLNETNGYREISIFKNGVTL